MQCDADRQHSAEPRLTVRRGLTQDLCLLIIRDYRELPQGTVLLTP